MGPSHPLVTAQPPLAWEPPRPPSPTQGPPALLGLKTRASRGGGGVWLDHRATTLVAPRCQTRIVGEREVRAPGFSELKKGRGWLGPSPDNVAPLV